LSNEATKLNEQKLDAEATNGSEVTGDYMISVQSLQSKKTI